MTDADSDAARHAGASADAVERIEKGRMTMSALRAYCRGWRAGVAAASDAEGRAFVTEARAVAVLRALAVSVADARSIIELAREEVAAFLGADADTYDVRCVAAQVVIDLVRLRLRGAT